MPASRVDSQEVVKEIFLLEGDALARAGFHEPIHSDPDQIEEFQRIVTKQAIIELNKGVTHE